ncbi:Tad domain-containing protein [Streptomyces thinghirensis]|nr:Tad domain-containing protein [Streptomyces thinghirensis]
MFVAVCVVALIGIIGVAVDGGGKMRATERADHVAGEAARAGGQAIDPTAAISGESIDGQAAGCRRRSAGLSPVCRRYRTVSVSADGKRLTVHTSDVYATRFLPVVGIGSMPVTGYGSATLLHGVTAPE